MIFSSIVDLSFGSVVKVTIGHMYPMKKKPLHLPNVLVWEVCLFLLTRSNVMLKHKRANKKSVSVKYPSEIGH